MGNVCSSGTSATTQEIASPPHRVVVSAASPDNDTKIHNNLPPMTKSELINKRNEFWSTQTEGKRAMWDALKFSCEQEDTDSARAIMDGANLTPWVYSTSDAYSYDCFGFKYIVPMWCIRDPPGLLPEGSTVKSSKIEPAPRTQEEILMDEESITIQCRFSDGSNDIALCLKRGTTFGEIRFHCRKQRDINERRVHSYHMGRYCSSKKRLREMGIQNNDIVQLFILPDLDEKGSSTS